MIKQPSEITAMNKKVRLLIAGFPGIGKSSLGLSAPKPLLIDVDKGIDRVAAQHRQPFIQPENYEEIMEDLTVEKLKDYETLVFDTGGQLLKLMAEWAKRQNTANVQRDGSLMALEVRGIQTDLGDEYRETITRNQEREMERQRQIERTQSRSREQSRSR